jgi:hypothetical protein
MDNIDEFNKILSKTLQSQFDNIQEIKIHPNIQINNIESFKKFVETYKVDICKKVFEIWNSEEDQEHQLDDNVVNAFVKGKITYFRDDNNHVDLKIEGEFGDGTYDADIVLNYINPGYYNKLEIKGVKIYYYLEL